MTALPSTDYEHGTWLLHIRAGREYLVPVLGSRYSVPWQYAGNHFDAKVTRTSVHLHRQGKLLRTHLKATRAGQMIVDQADMPESHKAVMLISQRPIADWYEFVGEDLLADAFLDRVRNRTHSFQLEGKSKRD